MKYFIAIIVTAVLVFLGATFYYKGLPTYPSYSKSAVSTESGLPVASNEVTSPSVSNDSTPTQAPAQTTVIKAGGLLSFKAYSVNVPSGWTSSTDGSVSGQVDKLTLTNSGYKIVISQAAFGGGGCVYPGDADQMMSVRFNGFNEVTTASGDALRVGVLPSGNRAVCQLQNGSWGDITSYGHIDITNPSTPDQTMLDQINSILSSLKKV